MKTKTYSFLFNKETVQSFIQLTGDLSPIYQSEDAARTHGYKSIPIPPTMPMVVYQQIEIPWMLTDPVIHRKQQIEYHQVMYIDQPYTGYVSLKKHMTRHNKTFIEQELEIFDDQGVLCYTGITNLIAGGLN